MSDEQFYITIGNEFIGSNEMVNAGVAAKIMGLSPRTVRDYATKRIIPIYKLNDRTTRFLVSDLYEWLDSKRVDINENNSPNVD